jgi:hypothetical protein
MGTLASSIWERCGMMLATITGPVAIRHGIKTRQSRLYASLAAQLC